MYYYLLSLYNYLVSLFTRVSQETGETWKEVFETIGPKVKNLDEKITTLVNSHLDDDMHEVIIDISKDFRTIQEITIRVQNMHVAVTEKSDRDKKVYDIAIFLTEKATLFRRRQQASLKRLREIEMGLCSQYVNEQ